MTAFSKFILASDTSIPKWKLAVIASATLMCGFAGYMYYRSKIRKSNLHEKEQPIPPAPPVPTSLKEVAENLKNQGNSYFRENDYANAIRCYNDAIAAIELYPKADSHQKATYFQNRAAAHERLNDLPKVIEDCTTAIELNKHYTKAIVRRAKAAERMNNLDAALDDWAMACFIEKYANTENIAELDRVSKLTANRDSEACIENNAPSLPSRFFIKTYLGTFQHGSAIDKVDLSDPTSEALLKEYKNLEASLIAGERIKTRCNDLIEKCREMNNDLIRLETQMLFATYNILSKQNKIAIAELTKILEEGENVDSRLRINALIKRGNLYQYRDETVKREEDFAKAIEIDPNNPDIYHHLGQLYLILDDINESQKNFQKAVELEPGFAVTVVQHNYTQYKCALLRNDTLEATRYFKHFEKILEKYPDSIECTTLYAQVLTERQEYCEAEKLYNRALEREPNHAAIYVHKALLILQWKADVESAMTLIKKALEIDSECEFAYETIGTIEMQMGNFASAVEHYNQAIKRYSTIEELKHLFVVRNTCQAQVNAQNRLGITRYLDGYVPSVAR